MTTRYFIIAAFFLFGCVETDPEATSESPVTEEVQQAAGPDLCPNVAGSWELIEIRETSEALSGEFESDPEYGEAPTLKILNETHWMFVRQTAESFVHAQGGRYTLDSLGRYTEHVEYSAIPQNVGQSFSFDCMIEGDSLWHHQGGQGDTRYDEVWRRVW